ncbi:hypothetical protein TNCV_5116091 [Trichonephila clavipes]|nr:hypothetical protein TNCV_5116091 [Trichonephila clavipes]
MTNFALKQQQAVSEILFLAREILRYEDAIGRGKNAFLLQTAISKPTFQKRPGGFELFITPNEGITSKIPSALWTKWMVSLPSGSKRPRKKSQLCFVASAASIKGRSFILGHSSPSRSPLHLSCSFCATLTH